MLVKRLAAGCEQPKMRQYGDHLSLELLTSTSNDCWGWYSTRWAFGLLNLAGLFCSLHSNVHDLCSLGALTSYLC